MPKVDLDGVDLADPAQRLEVASEFGAAAGDADAVMALGQCAHDVTAKEAGAAVDSDQAIGGAFRAHEIRMNCAVGGSGK
jgi:hypothetical protein